tara:strand:+ start:1690 stop:1941 length:252 start_codon:yes stop_codon:yes gene_type:complete
MSKVIDMGGKTPPNTEMKIDASELDDIICEECGGKVFRQASMFKRLSALISPTGKAQIVPIPVFRCDDCGHINKEFLPKSQKK